MQFPSGMVGVSIVLFALMGTIGVGYLLNGNTTYQTVDDYEYVTDVTGLYNYTPVAAYAPYSPAANNYQYSTVKADLGTYTSGISYTEAGAANLNPIITPSSGYVTTTVTIPYADLSEYEIVGSMETSIGWLLADAGSGYREEAAAPAKIISVKDLVADIGSFSSIEISLPNVAATADISSVSQNLTLQPVGVLVTGIYDSTYLAPLNFAVNNSATGASQLNATRYLVSSSVNNEFTVTGSNNRTYTSWPMGVASNLTVYPNGTTTYTYTYGNSVTTKTVNTENLKIYVTGEIPPNAGSNFTIPDYTPEITYTKTVFNNVDYLDANYGVSTTADTVYWSNGNDIGSVQWLIKRPSATTAQTFTAYHADDTAASTFTVNYDTWWTLSYNGATINMGKAWDGVIITAYYTGELQWSPVRSFTNFTEYRLGNTTTIEASAPMNAAISYYTITKTTGAPSFNFAVVGTSVASGTVPGAMFNASFNISNYFPQYDDVRVSFDSAAYVGTEVKVGTWTMDVDSGSFVGEFTIGSETYNVDLTKPWSINWTSADTVSITYTPYNKMGTKTVTILNQDAAKVVNLSGQWVIDTDLYEITSKEEPVYNWNFGHWGLSKVPFIVCVIGLIALLSIAYRIAGVNFHGLDYAVIALASLIIWVIL